MALDKCNEAIGAAIGRELTDRERRIVLSRATELKTKIERANNDPDATNTVLKEFASQVEMDAALRKRTAALNYTAFAKIEAWRKSVPYVVKNPSDGYLAFMRGSLRNFDRAKDSLATLVYHESTARSEALMADLQKAGLFKYAFDGGDDLNITKAWSDLKNDKEPDPSYGKNAIDAARIFDKHLEDLRQSQNGAGAFIGRAADRLWRRSHDANKIAKAGGNQYGSEAGGARDAWVAKVSGYLNWNKSFDGDYANASDGAKSKLLGDLWKNFATNDHFTPGTPHPPVGLGFRSLAKKLSHGRDLIFNSPENELAYYKEFGSGGSVAENVIGNLRGGGSDLALMGRLGMNPEATLDKMSQSWLADVKKNGTVKQYKELAKTITSERANTWRLLTEGAGHPADNFVGRFASAVRGVTNTAAMGMAAFSLPGDLALRARTVAQATGGSYAESLAKATAAMTTDSGLSKGEQQALFAELGIRTEGVHMPLDPHFADHVGFGAIAKFNRMAMAITPHAWWDNKFRLNSLVADTYRHWTLRDKSFDALTPEMQSTFAQFGIDKNGWDVIRKSDPSVIGKDTKAFMPSSIKDTALEKFKALAGADDATDAQLSRARNTLFENYRNMLGEMSDRSVAAPSLANKAVMGLGYKGFEPGTVKGELWRGALQLKGWAVNYMRNHLGAELYGYDTDYKTFGQAMVDVLKGKNPSAAMGLSRLVAAGTMIAMTTNIFRDLATGKTPENPLSENGVMRALARQSLGLYSDFLFQDAKPNASLWDRLGDMTGPELGFGADVFNSVTRVVTQANSAEGITPEKLGRDEQQWFGDIYRRVPGTQMFWSKFATDYMILNNLSEMLNPGYQQRLIDTAQKHNQHYWLGAPGPQTQQ